jgi:salicylate hydroxylase
LEKLKEDAITIEHLDMRRYEDGRIIVSKPLRPLCETLGVPWL